MSKTDFSGLSVDSLQRWQKEIWLHRRFLLYAGSFVVGSVALLVGSWQIWQSVRVVRADIKREQTAISKIEQRVSVLTSITDEDRATFAQVRQALPVNKEPLVVLQTLDAVARTAGVSLGQYDLNPGVVSTEAAQSAGSARSSRSRAAVTTSKWQTMPLKIEMTGSFSDIQAGIAALETALPLLEITEMSIDPLRRQTSVDIDTSQYTAVLQVRSFYLPIDASLVTRQVAQALNANQEKTRDQVLEYEVYVTTRPAAGEITPGGTASSSSGGFFQF